MPTVSVILTSYNHGKFVGAAIESVLAQTYTDFELLVWDDASTDDSWEVIARYNDPRIRRFRETRNAYGAYINRAIEQCRGEYVAIHHSDDLWRANKLERQVAVLRASPALGAVFCAPEFIGEDGKALADWHGEQALFATGNRSRHEWLRRFFYQGNALCHPSVLIRRACFDACGGYRLLFGQLPDFDMWVRLCLRYDIHVLPEKLVRFRAVASGQNMSAPTPGRTSRAFVESLEVLRSYLGIESADEVFGIFPELRAEFDAPAIEHDAQFLVAMAALRGVDFPWLRLLGTETLFALMRDPQRAARLERSYGFTRIDLHGVSAAGGVFAKTVAEAPMFVPGRKAAARRRRVVIYSLDRPEWACTQLRLLRPLAQMGEDFEVVLGVRWAPDNRYQVDLDVLGSADLVVLQRFFPCEATATQLPRIYAGTAPVVYELDDLLTDIPSDNPVQDGGEKGRNHMRQAMQLADAVTVSTEALAESVRPFNANVHVIPNLVEPALFAPTAAAPRNTGDGPLTLGVTGSLTHAGDFAMLDEALRQVLERYGARVRILFVGSISPGWLARPDPRVAQAPFVFGYLDYAAKLASFGIDVALVPLTDHAFNRAKSDIKWLEYTAAGIPAVFSDLPPYAGVVHGSTGLKVANTTRAWFDAIVSLIEAPQLRQQIIANARTAMRRRCVTEPEALAAQRDLYLQLLREGRKRSAVPPPPPPQPAVLPWMPAHRWLPGERDWARDALGAAATTPRIALACLAPSRAAAPAAVVEHDWPGSDTVRVIALDDGGAGDALLRTANAALRAAAADWVGTVDGGDRLAPDAAFRIVHALQRNPHWQVVYTDEDSLTADGQHVNPHCKPDFNLDYLRSLPYAGGLLLIRRDLFDALGGFNPELEGAEDYDLLLRAWEHLQRSGDGERAIGHVAEVLYHRAQGSGHTSKSVPEILAAGQAALQAHFRRLGIAATVQPGPFPPSFRVRWPLPDAKPKVSILVPTRNQLGFLQRCIESVIEKTKYPAYEIIIIDNASDEADTCRYLDAVASREAELGDRLRVLRHPGPFNFSAMNNAAARAARGDYLLLLNNDTAALHDDWLDEMMSHAVRPDVGIVGAKLLYPDGRIQHAGVILGLRGPAEHPFIGRAPEDRGYFGRAQLAQDLSAVTGACLLVRRSVYDQVGGLDETDFKVSYNDIDLCLKVRNAGLRVVFTPFALLMHEGSASQKGKVEAAADEAKLKRYAAEKDAMYRKWLPALASDPAYNRHLSLATTEFQLDDQPCLAWDPDWRPRPRILAHAADREGCGEYRIIAPLRALNRAGLTQGWETMRLFEPVEMQRIDADVLVVQRQMEWPQIEAIERNGRYHRAFRVFEIDDLITNLPVKSVHKKQMHKDIAKRFRKAAGLCHRLVVATEPLARAYAGFADEVVVCPNHVEGARWGHLQPPRAQRARPRVGWAGGIGHTGDLELIADVVRDTADDIDWVFFGMCPDSLKGVVKEFHPGVPLDQYAAKLASLDLDLAVAPLEDNPFNEAKSHLRLLEYGILGYPVICSNLVPYQGDFPVTRVANRYRDWIRAIRDAIADRAALRAQGDALRDKIRGDWLMEDHLERWMKAWTP